MKQKNRLFTVYHSLIIKHTIISDEKQCKHTLSSVDFETMLQITSIGLLQHIGGNVNNSHIGKIILTVEPNLMVNVHVVYLPYSQYLHHSHVTTQ